MRFSLRWLFGLTSFVAVACACLIFASDSVTTWMGLVLHLFLLLSVLGAFYAPRERRAFWGGCATAGWYYLGSGYLPFELKPLRNTATDALREVYWKITPNLPDESPIDTEDETDEVDETPIAIPMIVPRPVEIPHDVLVFHEVGQMLATFLAAFAGGGVALWFDRRALRKPDPMPVS
jgi:hypothetical protein